MDFEKMANDVLAPGHFYGGSPGNEEIAEWAYRRIECALRAAFAAGREAMRTDCIDTVDRICWEKQQEGANLEIRAKILTADSIPAYIAIPAYIGVDIIHAIRALPGKEG